MRTLDRWTYLLAGTPFTIDCPRMQLIGAIEETSPVFFGSGYVEIQSSTQIRYTMFGYPNKGLEVLQLLREADEHPYDALKQFRLLATDYEGTEWNCGWTSPQITSGKDGVFVLRGDVRSLGTGTDGYWVSTESSAELIFQLGYPLPLEQTLVSVAKIGDEVVSRRSSPGRQTIQVLGSTINFFYPPWSGKEQLWMVATTSDSLNHPYLENWLSEPLRVMFGQLLYPRLVARNFQNSRAQVSLRPSPENAPVIGIAGLLKGDFLVDARRFWHLYERLLVFIAEARSKDGGLNIESNPVTRFHEEIIQVQQGSRWVLCMTLASAVEGLARGLNSYLTSGNFCTEPISGGTGPYLHRLSEHGVLSSEGVESWKDMRHAVMHGNLVKPWGTEDEDTKITNLSDTVRRLTLKLVGVDDEP